MQKFTLRVNSCQHAGMQIQQFAPAHHVSVSHMTSMLDVRIFSSSISSLTRPDLFHAAGMMPGGTVFRPHHFE
jgi:hypothetical protein